MQLSYAVPPEIMFKDYPYCSGTSKTALDFFDKFADKALAFKEDSKTVMDIACNDGTQLDAFKRRGLITYGVDPAENLMSMCFNKGHEIECCFVEDYKTSNKFDIITAQNVFAHNLNPFNFLMKCKEMMHDDSVLFIQTSQANMISNNEFDTIYHEHISYFNSKSMKLLVERAGLEMYDIQLNPIHGTSYIFVIKKKNELNDYYVSLQIKDEENRGMFKMSTYQKWVKNVNSKIDKTKTIIDEYRRNGYIIVGCGAAAKGLTLLNVAGIQLNSLIDTTRSKWFYDASGSIIYPFEFLRRVNDDKVLFVILAWNFDTEIMENIKKIRNNKNDRYLNSNSGVIT